MWRYISIFCVPFIVFATGITTSSPKRLTKVAESMDVYPYLRATEPSPNLQEPSKNNFESLSEDSIRTVLLPGEAVYIRVDASSDSVRAVDMRDSLPDNCYDAINISPKWLRDDLYQSFRLIEHRIGTRLASDFN